MRILVHDYAGHPFQFELSRALAARGHTVRHTFFADDPGPKGPRHVAPGDPPGLSIAPLTVRMRYRKDRFLRRCVADHLYGLQVCRDIKAFRPDVVLSGNTPLDAQQAVRRATAAIGARFIFWVQDFYSLAVERLLRGRWHGVGRVIAWYYRRIETRLLKSSYAIVLISPDFRRHLPTSIKDESIHVIRNWGMLLPRSVADGVNAWSARQGLDDKFVFMYTGTLGLKNDPRLLLVLADAFAPDTSVEIVIIAGGANAKTLSDENQRSPRRNLRLLPLQSIDDMPDVLSTASVLVALLEQDAGEFSVPSKLLSYFAAGRPVLLSAPGGNLSSRVLEESSGGLRAEPSDTGAFIAAARRLRQDDELRRSLGGAGRQYSERNFNIEAIASRFEHSFGIAPERQPVTAGVTAGPEPVCEVVVLES